MAQKRTDEYPVTVYYRYRSISEFKSSRRLRGPFRVLVFCLLAVLLPCLLLAFPLYIRYELYKDVAYHLGESDLVTVDRPISTLWCSGQDLRMNATFHAYLLNEQPRISEDLKLIEMKKHMQLADDTLEYWGFFFLQGSKVTLSVCSRFDGARLMVVKGTKNLKQCALIEANRNKDQIDPWEEDVSAPQGEKIEVTFQEGEQTTVPKKIKSNSKVSSNVGTPTNTSGIQMSNNDRNVITDALEIITADSTSPKGRPGRRGRKPYVSNSVDVSEPTALGSEIVSVTARSVVGSGTLNENMKILKHKTHHGISGTRRRRLITTTDEKVDLDSGIVQMLDSGEEEQQPNPVGVEPLRMRFENQAEVTKDEVIDEEDIRSSGSSFAKNLWNCYGGDIIFTQTFSPSPRCQSQDAMMKYVRMTMVHEVTSTGYYYYIFYSDNDIVSNDIFARFNIEKVQYSFPNYTNSCRNATTCSLPFAFFSSEKVLLEVPIQDGVSDEDALAQMELISSCRPRLGIYLIFPFLIIFVILTCAFL